MLTKANLLAAMNKGYPDFEQITPTARMHQIAGMKDDGEVDIKTHRAMARELKVLRTWFANQIQKYE